MSLKHSYSLLAYIYDPLIEKATRHWRKQSLSFIAANANKKVLLNGIGSGLDIPHLTLGNQYIGTDITPAMLKRAQAQADNSTTDIKLQLEDSMQLSFADQTFDVVVMHLILAVVPQPELALAEAARILKPGGQIIIFDKFLKPGQLAPCRRFINLFLRHIATRTDVVFETLLTNQPTLTITHQEDALANGWFRFLILSKAE